MSKALVSLGLVGAGGYAIVNSPMAGQIKFSEPDPTIQELEEAHGNRLIANFNSPHSHSEADGLIVKAGNTEEMSAFKKAPANHFRAKTSANETNFVKHTDRKTKTKTSSDSTPFSGSSSNAKESIAAFAPRLKSAFQKKAEEATSSFDPRNAPSHTSPLVMKNEQPPAAPKHIDSIAKSPRMLQSSMKSLDSTPPRPSINNSVETAPRLVQETPKTGLPAIKRFESNPDSHFGANQAPAIPGTTALNAPPSSTPAFRKPTPPISALNQPPSQPTIAITKNPDANNAFSSISSQMKHGNKSALSQQPKTNHPALPDFPAQQSNPNGIASNSGFAGNQDAFNRRRLQGNTLSQTPTQSRPMNQNPAFQNLNSKQGVSPTPRSIDRLQSLRTPDTNIPATLASTTIGINSPALRQFEGVQTPALSLEKSAPKEIQVGRPATFRLIVKNNGRVPAYGVTIVDEVPNGTRLQAATPDPTTSNGSKMTWDLGTLEPGDVAEVVMELLPMQQGEIGSVAHVTFKSQASVRTVCTKPKLEIQHTAVSKALIGDTVVVEINVRNSGDGAATSVTVEEIVPENLLHADSNGRKLQYPIGRLGPGESRNLTLRLKADRVGTARNLITATGDGGLSAQDELNIEVIAPELQLSANGPTKRYLERQATYEIGIVNRGTARATNVRLVAKLPRGMKYIQADKNGQYDSRAHAVYWSLVQLPTDSEGRVKLTLLPIDVGHQKIDCSVSADLNLQQTKEVIVAVEQYSELFFDVDDVADPIEIGTDTVYNIRVENQGSKPATNVRVVVQLPDSLKSVNASGPVQHQLSANSIQFAPIPRLAPNASAKFSVQVKGQREGDHRIQVKLSSDERREVVAKEESTKVYSDYR